MSFVVHSLALARGAGICGLALALLLTPMCGALCHAQSCPAPAHEKTSGCHDSAGAVLGGSANGTIDSVRTCNLGELPAVLPGNSRSSWLRATPLVKSPGRGEFLVSPAFAHLPVWSRQGTAARCARGEAPRLDAGSSFLILRI